VWSNASEIATGFLNTVAYQLPHKTRNAGAFVNTQDNPVPEQQGFTTEDILWAVGIWSVILCLSPVIVFYVLMVA
jgi:hypothetical protein